jgi:5-formyltetrahydrofolate cyclo-ligase
VNQEKKDLRKEMAVLRDAVPEGEKSRLDSLVTRHFLDWEVYLDSRSLFCYVSFRSEIDTTPIMEDALREGKTVAVPRIHPASHIMGAYVVTSLHDDLESGYYGIPEPKRYCIEADCAELDLILVPGLAFTSAGYRLGYGGGFYDRFLSAHGRDAVTCSLAYDRLVLDSLPLKNHDLPVDYLITETGVNGTRGAIPRP